MLKNICIFILKNPTKHSQGNYVRKFGHQIYRETLYIDSQRYPSYYRMKNILALNCTFHSALHNNFLLLFLVTNIRSQLKWFIKCVIAWSKLAM